MLKALLLLALLPASLDIIPRPHFTGLRVARSSPSQTQPRPQPHNYGVRADSLNGIPGHAFGEPRSSFPELATKGYQDLDGYTYYSAKEGQEIGWFGKNAGHVRTTYRFYRDNVCFLRCFGPGH